MRIAFICDNYRAVWKFRAAMFKQKYGADNVVVAEWFKSSSVYHWEQDAKVKTIDHCSSFTAKPQEYEGQSVNPGQILVKASRFLKRNKVDVCFSHGYWPPPAVAVLAACLINRIPCVLMNDSHRLSAKASSFGHFVKKAIVKRFSAAFVGGPSQVLHYEDLGIKKGRVFHGMDIVDNGFFGTRAATAKLHAQETRNRLGLPQRYFLNLGRMARKKNLKTLITAYSIVRKSDKVDADLVFVGSGECEDELKKHALSLGLPVYDNLFGTGTNMKGVYFYRHQASDDLPSFYGLAEAFVLPSESEEWGLVVNEAMACGVPVVVSSKCGCAPDLVRPGVNGFQFNYDNPEELAMRMIEIGSQPDLARKMGRSSLEMISKWDWTLFLRNVECAVESVCTRPNGQA